MKVKNKIIAMFFVIILFLICCNNKSSAVSAKLSASSTNVTVGKPVTINVNINAAAWSINVSGAVTGSYVDNTEDAEDTNITKTLSFTPSKAGSYVVKLSGNVTGSKDVSATTVSDSITITVKEEEKNNNIAQNTSTTNSNTSTGNNTSKENNSSKTATETKPVETKKSSNANITSLWITPKEYDFTGSKASVLEYNTKVPYEIEEITVGGRTEDSKAKFTSGIGKQKLQVGKNAIKIVVSAEDGTKKTYTINVTREEKKAEEVKKIENSEENKTEVSNTVEDTNTILDKANTIAAETTIENNEKKKFKDSDLVSLEVKDYKISPEYSPDVFEYRINVDNKVDSIDVIAEKKDKNVNVEIVGNTNLKEGENVITILVHNENTNKNYTYQIIVDKLSELNLNNLNQTLDNKTKNAEKNKKIFIGFIIGINALIIIYILIKNIRKSEEEDNEDEEDEDFSNRLKLQEDEEMFERIDKKNNEQYEEKEISAKQRKKGKHF